MRRLAVGLALLVAPLGVGACSYIFDLPASYDALTLPDAGDDGALADVMIPEPYVPEASPPFCETQTSPFLFCEDFDNDPLPDLGTIGNVQSDGGRVLISNAIAFSTPRSLLTSTSAPAASATIARSFDASPGGVVLSFELLVSALVTPTQLSQIVFTDGDQVCRVQLIGGPGTTFSITQLCTNAGVEVTKTTTDTAIPIERGQWSRYALAVRFAPAPTITLAREGAAPVEVSGVAPLHAAPMSIEVGVGLAPAGTIALFYDDVLVTTP